MLLLARWEWRVVVMNCVSKGEVTLFRSIRTGVQREPGPGIVAREKQQLKNYVSDDGHSHNLQEMSECGLVQRGIRYFASSGSWIVVLWNGGYLFPCQVGLKCMSREYATTPVLLSRKSLEKGLLGWETAGSWNHLWSWYNHTVRSYNQWCLDEVSYLVAVGSVPLP